MFRAGREARASRFFHVRLPPHPAACQDSLRFVFVRRSGESDEALRGLGEKPDISESPRLGLQMKQKSKLEPKLTAFDGRVSDTHHGSV